MKQILFTLIMGGCACVCAAQTDDVTTDTMQLDEVVVEGAQVINRNDGSKVIYPSEKQKENSTSAYALLKMLHIPNLKVDDVSNTVSVSQMLGSVDIRINDIKATKSDLVSLDMKSVKSVEYITNPGARYGQDVFLAVNIVTRHAVSGYVLGANARGTFTSEMFDYGAYGKFNHRKSELSIDWSGSYNNIKDSRSTEEGHYIMADGSVADITRKDRENRKRSYNHDIQMRHTLMEPERYTLQTTLSLGYNRTPESHELQDVLKENDSYQIENNDKSRVISPSLDIYALMYLGKRQTLTSNITGSFSRSDISSGMTTAGIPYNYKVRGKSYSLYSEATYENRLEALTLSAGVQHTQKYIDNMYTGDVEATSVMHLADTYLWAQIKGSLSGFGYSLGAGADRIYFRSGGDNSNTWTFRPKITLSRSIGKGLFASYDFSYGPYLSRMQYVNDVAVRTNDMEITQGNTNLRPCRRIEHILTLSYEKDRLYTVLTGFYRGNHNAVMQKIYRNSDGLFVFTRENQKDINMFYIQNLTQYKFIKDRLSVYISPSISRMYNYGDSYKHHYTSFNIYGGIEASIGRFAFNVSADNGYSFLEGETRGKNPSQTLLTASYKTGCFTFMAYWSQWFRHAPKMYQADIYNRFVRKTVTERGGDYGNILGLKITWKLTKGRKYEGLQRGRTKKDTDTGIVSK